MFHDDIINDKGSLALLALARAELKTYRANRLSDEQIEELRSMECSVDELMKHFDISRSTVYRMKKK